MKPALFLGDEPRIIVPAARSLWRRGIPVSVAGSGTNLLALQSRAIKRFHQLMVEGEAESPIDCLETLINTEQPDWLLPTSDSALLFVANHYARLKRLIKLACPNAATIMTVLDKESTIAAAVRCGIAVPHSHKIPTLSQFREQREGLRFPLIAKPRCKRPGASFKLRYYRDWPELEQEFQRESDFGRKYMLQEYEPGEGVGIEVLMADGCPQMLFAHRRLQEFPHSGGVSVVANSEELYPELVEGAVALLREIGWEGLAMVEYRYDRDSRRAALMEINGRLWGSVGLSIAAGIDFPFAAWGLAHGHKVLPTRYKSAIRARWTGGIILRLHELFVNPGSDGTPKPSTLRELFSAAKLFLSGTNDMLWVWDDPLPAIFELLLIGGRLCQQTMKSLVRTVLPKPMLARLRIWRLLEHGTRGIYMRSELHRILPWRTRLPAQVRSALCVCHGNIIRSPFASMQLARLGLQTVSAGLEVRTGRGADKRAIRIASEFGVSLAEHAAHALTKAMIEHADVIFVMDGINEARLLSRYPQARKKLLLLGSFAPQRLPADEIPDPYHADDKAIRRCYEVISACVMQISSCLRLAKNSGRVVRT